MKTFFKVKLVSAAAIIALALITSAYAAADKPPSLNKLPVVVKEGEYPAGVALAATWNEGISNFIYLGAFQNMHWLVKNHWVPLGFFMKNSGFYNNYGFFASTFSFNYTDTEGNQQLLAGYAVADSFNSECVMPMALSSVQTSGESYGRLLHFEFYKFKKYSGNSASTIGQNQTKYMAKVGKTLTFCSVATRNPANDAFYFDVAEHSNLGFISIKVYFTNGSSDHNIKSMQQTTVSNK